MNKINLKNNPQCKNCAHWKKEEAGCEYWLDLKDSNFMDAKFDDDACGNYDELLNEGQCMMSDIADAEKIFTIDDFMEAIKGCADNPSTRGWEELEVAARKVDYLCAYAEWKAIQADRVRLQWRNAHDTIIIRVNDRTNKWMWYDYLEGDLDLMGDGFDSANEAIDDAMKKVNDAREVNE